MTNDLRHILLSPVVTEKSSAHKELFNKVTFKVSPTATKTQIKNAVEKAFQVKVLSVSTLNVPGKMKRTFAGRRRLETKTSLWKKAVVKLKEGSKIEFTEGA